MENKLLMNMRGRNHIRFLPLSDVESIPKDEGDQIRWAEAEYERLRTSPDAKRLSLYVNKAKGYLISVWTLGGVTYLIQCLRIRGIVYDTTIYRGNNEGDALAIAKFLRQNADAIMRDQAKQLKELNKRVAEAKLNAVSGQSGADPVPEA